jgi:hypothetical protein
VLPNDQKQSLLGYVYFLLKKERGRLKMKDGVVIKMGCLVTCLAIVVPVQAIASTCDCSPKEWDFGDVPIGSASTVIFSLTNYDVVETAIRNIWIVNTTNDSFKILVDTPPPAIYIPIGNTYDIVVEFSPAGLGPHSAELRLSRNAEFPDVYVPVQGVGVIEKMPPGEMMTYLIEALDEFIENETIRFSGRASVANRRMQAFRNMINASSDLINGCDYESACVQLRDTLNRTDGEKHPPDFIEGLNAETLESMIQDVIKLLECR